MKTKLALNQLQDKIQTTKKLISKEREKLKSDFLQNSNETSLQRLTKMKGAIEKKIQDVKSKNSDIHIRELQKKLVTYQKEMKETEMYGLSHKKKKALEKPVFRFMELGVNISEGSYGYKGRSLIEKPCPIVYMEKVKFGGSMDNLDRFRNTKDRTLISRVSSTLPPNLDCLPCSFSSGQNKRQIFLKIKEKVKNKKFFSSSKETLNQTESSSISTSSQENALAISLPSTVSSTSSQSSVFSRDDNLKKSRHQELRYIETSLLQHLISLQDEQKMLNETVILLRETISRELRAANYQLAKNSAHLQTLENSFKDFSKHMQEKIDEILKKVDQIKFIKKEVCLGQKNHFGIEHTTDGKLSRINKKNSELNYNERKPTTMTTYVSHRCFCMVDKSFGLLVRMADFFSTITYVIVQLVYTFLFAPRAKTT